MAAKMANFMQKYVHLNNAGYNEAIFHIVMVKVQFYIKAQTSLWTQDVSGIISDTARYNQMS